MGDGHCGPDRRRRSERHLSVQTFGDDQVRNLHRPFFGFSSTGEEVIILKQKNRDAAVAMQIDHLIDDCPRRSQATQWTTLVLVKRSNAAERAIPWTATAAEN